MEDIKIREKITAGLGKTESYYYENNLLGLAKTLFYRIIVPLEPINSCLDYVDQPEQTEIVIEWIDAKSVGNIECSKLILSTNNNKTMEASIYLGSAHNKITIESLVIEKVEDHYCASMEGIVDLESEGVALNELISLKFRINETILFIKK